MIAKWFILLLFIAITLAQAEETQTPQQTHQPSKLKVLKTNQVTKNAELVKKHSARLYRQHYQEYNMKVINYTDFIIIPEVDQEVTIVIDVLWKQKNVFLMAPVQKDQQITVYVQQQNKGNIYQDSFYTMTGFRFQARAKVSYKVVFKQSGNEQKMLIAKISQKVAAPKKAAKKQGMKLAQQRLTYALNKLQNSLSQVKTGQLLDKQVSSYVLYQSTAYSYFQAFQSLLIVLISIFQVIFVSKLLKVSSIV